MGLMEMNESIERALREDEERARVLRHGRASQMLELLNESEEIGYGDISGNQLISLIHNLAAKVAYLQNEVTALKAAAQQ